MNGKQKNEEISVWICVFCSQNMFREQKKKKNWLEMIGILVEIHKYIVYKMMTTTWNWQKSSKFPSECLNLLFTQVFVFDVYTHNEFFFLYLEESKMRINTCKHIYATTSGVFVGVKITIQHHILYLFHQ